MARSDVSQIRAAVSSFPSKRARSRGLLARARSRPRSSSSSVGEVTGLAREGEARSARPASSRRLRRAR